MKLKIYTDGACSGNPGKGGWAAIIINEDKKKELFGMESNINFLHVSNLDVYKNLNIK